MSDDPDWIDELYADGPEALPPAALDEKIRAAARQPVRHPWYRSPGRLTALATAASLVIAVSVIYFEPDQLTLEAPAPELEPQTSQSRDREAEVQVDALSSGRLEEKMVGAAKSETAEQKSTLARKISNEPADSAAGAAPAAAPAARPVPTAPDQQPERMTSSSLRAMEQDLSEDRIDEALTTDLSDQATLLEEEPAAELAQLCGTLPGTAETREIQSDEAGWLVTVTVGEDIRTWRCIDGAWVETTSEQ